MQRLCTKQKDKSSFWNQFNIFLDKQRWGSIWSGQCQSHEDSLIIVLDWALVCLYECAQRKMNEIPIHEGNRKLPCWRRLCAVWCKRGANCVALMESSGCRPRPWWIQPLIFPPQGSEARNNKKYWIVVAHPFTPFKPTEDSLGCFCDIAPSSAGTKAVGLVINATPAAADPLQTAGERLCLTPRNCCEDSYFGDWRHSERSH